MRKTSISNSHRPLAERDFCRWVGQAGPGDILEYHRGFLALDTDTGARSDAQRKTLRQLARRAAWAFDEGLVHLVQHRNGPDSFAYLAVKRPRPRVARAARRRADRLDVANDPELEAAA